MIVVEFIGFIAALLSTMGFLPQVIKTWQTRSADDLSMDTIIVLLIGVFLWLLYGLMNKDRPLIFANGLTMIFVSFLLYFKVKFNDRSNK
ncbi:MAG: SemiSWEET transporter [Bacteroidota bacterium]